MRTKLVRQRRTLWKRWSQPPEIEPHHLVGEKPWRGFRTKARNCRIAAVFFVVTGLCLALGLVFMGDNAGIANTGIVALALFAAGGFALVNAKLTQPPDKKHEALDWEVR